MAIEPHARVAGGYITIDGVQIKRATVSLSFHDRSFIGGWVYCNLKVTLVMVENKNPSFRKGFERYCYERKKCIERVGN